jgi:hypothetical protein
MKNALSTDDLADLLGVEVRTLRRWNANGTGPKRVIEDLKPVYPIKSLRAWLKIHRKDVKLGAASASEKNLDADAAAWDEFYDSCEPQRRQDAAYQKACQLDNHGDHAAADKVLLKAGVAPETVKSRRKHLEYTERL